MRRLLVFLPILAACAPAETVSTPDAGATPTPDAGVAITLPENPTLDDLAAFWDSRRCRVWACVNHERENAATCARAAADDTFPFDAFSRAKSSVSEGRGTYDAAAGKQCAQVLAAIDTKGDCYGQDAPSFVEAERVFRQFCGDLVTGTVANGGACDDDWECVPGGACRFDFNREGTCFGTCVVWLKPGENCADRPQDCRRDAYCDGTVCQARQLKPNGQFCTDGFECVSGKCFDYACKDYSDFQGECVTNDDCGTGYYCRALPPSTGKLGICQVGALEGSACGYAVKCSGNQLCAGYSQKYQGGNKDGVCRGHPGAVGDACTPLVDGYDFGETGCYDDLLCNAATKKCEEPPALGAACSADGRCGPGAYCDGGTCRAKKADGETAATWAECVHAWDQNEKTCFDPAERNRCYQP